MEENDVIEVEKNGFRNIPVQNIVFTGEPIIIEEPIIEDTDVQ